MQNLSHLPLENNGDNKSKNNKNSDDFINVQFLN